MTTIIIRSPRGLEARRLGFLRYQARMPPIEYEWRGISWRSWRLALKVVRKVPESGWTIERVD